MPEALDVKGKRTRTRWVNPLGPEEPDAAGRDGAAAADDEAARGRASAAAADDEPEPEPELEESEEPLVAQIAQLKAEIKQLRIELGGSPLADDAAADDDETPLVQQTPTNFHQAAVFYLASDAPRDAAMAARAPLLFIGSLSMVVTQTLVALGVFAGTISPTCSSSSQCAAGTYCKVSSDSAWSARCLWCGADPPLPMSHEGVCHSYIGSSPSAVGHRAMEFTIADSACTTYNNANDPNHVGFNLTLVSEVCTPPYTAQEGLDAFGEHQTFDALAVASWCETCMLDDGSIDAHNFAGLMAASLGAMGKFDNGSLVFATIFIAIIVVGELKDILLCSMAIAQHAGKLSAGWRHALIFLLGIRRWIFLPALVCTVPLLVMVEGGDALKICLNTVAILFLCDIDDIAFRLALSERVRARVEVAGRLELNAAEATALARTKAVHIGLIVLAVLAGVWSSHPSGVFSPFAAFMLGGVVESFSPGATTMETAKRVSKVLGGSLAGYVCARVWML